VHSVRVYRFILRLINNPALPEDLVTEVFLDVWHQAAKFRAKPQVSTWLLATARNKALSALRHRPHEPLDEDALAMMVNPADDSGTAVEKKDRRRNHPASIKKKGNDFRWFLDV
jgi:RNA polymerase sigma-70 factor (ECF subfamily)